MNEQGRSPAHLNRSSAHDTLRWGDFQNLLNLETLNGEASAITTRQLAAAHWRWPLTWTLQIVLMPAFDAAETAKFTVDVLVSLGVGQAAAISYPLTYTLSPTAGVYLPVTDQRFLPAQDIQLSARVFNATNVTGAHNSLGVGLFLAPMTEPHAMTAILDGMHDEPPEQVEWMQEGFHETPLEYRR